MARSLIRIGSVIAAILLVAWIYIGCSDDDVCPTCPGGGGSGATLNLEVMHPQPDPMRYHDVFAVAHDDFFIAGEGGVVLRRQSGVWSRYQTPATSSLRAIWGTSATDVWAVGTNGVIVHFDGATWSSMPSGVFDHLEGVWGTSPTNVYAVGQNNAVLRYMGARWEMMDLGLPPATRNFRDVWGYSATDIYAVGNASAPIWQGVADHFDGSRWSESIVPNPLQTVWGVQPDTVYAAANGNIWRYYGTTWVQQTTLGDYVSGVWGSAWNDVWAVGSRWDSGISQTVGLVHHYDGTGWTAAPGATFPHQLLSVHGLSANEVYVCGERGQAGVYSGFDWDFANDQWATGSSLQAITGMGSGELMAFGDRGTTIHFDGVDWVDLRRITDQTFYSVWAADPDTLVAVGSNSTIAVYDDGIGWQQVPHMINIGGLRTVWGTGTNDIRAGGDMGQMIHLDGGGIHVDTIAVATTSSIIDLWGSAPDDWYAASYYGVVHYDGNSWTPLPLDGRTIQAIHGVSPTEVYFAGGSGRTPVNGPAQKPSKIAGPIGRGFLLRWDGNTYTEVAADFDMGVEDIWAVGTNNVFLAGNSSDRFAMGHFNGSGVAIGTNSAAYGAYGIWATGRTAYAVGQNGVVGRVIAP